MIKAVTKLSSIEHSRSKQANDHCSEMAQVLVTSNSNQRPFSLFLKPLFVEHTEGDVRRARHWARDATVDGGLVIVLA
jgi:hypothetical protein